VIVATCDQEIMDVVTDNGGKAVMTADTHERCTDRIAEAAFPIDADIIINVQGDEPLVQPAMFEPLVAPLIGDPDLLCTNLMNEIDDEQDFNSSDVVKTVCDLAGNALYFSREPIPSVRKAGGLAYKRYRQLGIIALRKDFLHRFNALLQTPAERVESVDMLRAIEYGYRVRMVLSPYKVMGVDTPADLARVISRMEQDTLCAKYI
jgi:3-deoxy-manno-octulosonate cytidylyltransferase (CMP-KDO synthetase)